MSTITYERPVALVTGATSGIGAAYARRFAVDGNDVIMHGRREEKLRALAKELSQTHGVVTEVLLAELSDPEELARVEQRIAALERLDVLVNNAGFHIQGELWENDLDFVESMIRVHVIASVRLTGMALRGMVARGVGTIINVASIGAFLRGGNGVETYAPTKAYLVALTESMHLTLRGTGVRVQAVIPGFTRTDFHTRMGIDPDTIRMSWQMPEEVVEQSLRDLKKGRVISYSSWRMRSLQYVARCLPRPWFYRAMLLYRRMRDSVYDDEGETP